MAPAKNKNKQTRFPVARIKKIMQKDEDVGKVAHGTPVIISKALELFLAVIVDEASKVTLERGSKKVEAYHLKHAIETVGTLDFLKELVENVADPSAGGTIDLEAQQAEAAAKRKRGKGKGKKAKEDDEDNDGTKEPAPKRKRKTKAQVEADKAEKALAAAEKADVKARASAGMHLKGSSGDEDGDDSGDEEQHSDEPYMPPR